MFKMYTRKFGGNVAFTLCIMRWHYSKEILHRCSEIPSTCYV